MHRRGLFPVAATVETLLGGYMLQESNIQGAFHCFTSLAVMICKHTYSSRGNKNSPKEVNRFNEDSLMPIKVGSLKGQDEVHLSF